MKKHVMAYAFMVIAGLSIIAPPSPAQAAAPCSPPNFLGIPAWYRGLQDKSDCANIKKVGVETYFLTIGLNVLQGAMVVVAYVTVGFIIKGGYMYIVSAGNPESMAKAKNTIRDALIGLVIAISAAAIVNMVAGVI
jgi:hypothetical protein